MGLLSFTTEERVNLVNAPLFARQRGLHVVEQKDPGGDHLTNLVTVEVHTDQGVTRFSGPAIDDRVHLVRVGDYPLDVELAGP